MVGLAVKLEIELDVLLSENIGAIPSIARMQNIAQKLLCKMLRMH